MSASNGVDHKGSAASHLRPRHQISRSISELSPIHLHRHHHGSHHSRSHSRRDKHERASERDDHLHYTKSRELRASLDLPRSEAAESLTPGTLSPDQSRRTSALIAVGDEQMGAGQETGPTTTLYTRKLSRDEELQEERRKAAVRASGMKKSLAELSTFSNATTRRLDDTYYSVLEKVDMLQHTIVALKELAGMSQETSRQFERDSEEIVGEMTTQLEAFGGFGEQERRIQALTARIHGGRDKVKALSERVDVVRERIEAWERADREWQERTRRRLKAIWVVTSVLLALLLVLLVVAQYLPATADDASRAANTSGAAVIGGGLRGALGAPPNVSLHRAKALDERLRLLDEL